jgi:hypothetical protein
MPVCRADKDHCSGLGHCTLQTMHSAPLAVGGKEMILHNRCHKAHTIRILDETTIAGIASPSVILPDRAVSQFQDSVTAGAFVPCVCFYASIFSRFSTAPIAIRTYIAVLDIFKTQRRCLSRSYRHLLECSDKACWTLWTVRKALQ